MILSVKKVPESTNIFENNEPHKEQTTNTYGDEQLEDEYFSRNPKNRAGKILWNGNK